MQQPIEKNLLFEASSLKELREYGEKYLTKQKGAVPSFFLVKRKDDIHLFYMNYNEENELILYGAEISEDQDTVTLDFASAGIKKFDYKDIHDLINQLNNAGMKMSTPQFPLQKISKWGLQQPPASVTQTSPRVSETQEFTTNYKADDVTKVLDTSLFKVFGVSKITIDPNKNNIGFRFDDLEKKQHFLFCLINRGIKPVPQKGMTVQVSAQDYVKFWQIEKLSQRLGTLDDQIHGASMGKSFLSRLSNVKASFEDKEIKKEKYDFLSNLIDLVKKNVPVAKALQQLNATENYAKIYQGETKVAIDSCITKLEELEQVSQPQIYHK